MLAVLAAAAALAAPAPTYWAYALHPTVARADANATATPVGVVRGVTPEGETNLVVVYEQDVNELVVHASLSRSTGADLWPT